MKKEEIESLAIQELEDDGNVSQLDVDTWVSGFKKAQEIYKTHVINLINNQVNGIENSNFIPSPIRALYELIDNIEELDKP